MHWELYGIFNFLIFRVQGVLSCIYHDNLWLWTFSRVFQTQFLPCVSFNELLIFSLILSHFIGVHTSLFLVVVRVYSQGDYKPSIALNSPYMKVFALFRPQSLYRRPIWAFSGLKTTMKCPQMPSMSFFWKLFCQNMLL